MSGSELLYRRGAPHARGTDSKREASPYPAHPDLQVPEKLEGLVVREQLLQYAFKLLMSQQLILIGFIHQSPF